MCGALHWASKPHGCLFYRTAEASVQAPAKLPRARGGEVGAVRLQAMEGPKQENKEELLTHLRVCPIYKTQGAHLHKGVALSGSGSPWGEGRLELWGGGRSPALWNWVFVIIQFYYVSRQ